MNIYCWSFLTTLTECLDGYFGRYCTPCTFPSYGYLCRFTCTCLQHLCHNVHGCQGRWFTYTVPRYFCSILLQFLLKMLISVKEEQLKSIKRKNILDPKYLYWYIISFFQSKKQISYVDLQWEMLTSFLDTEVTRNTCTSHNFSTLSPGYYHLACNVKSP